MKVGRVLGDVNVRERWVGVRGQFGYGDWVCPYVAAKTWWACTGAWVGDTLVLRCGHVGCVAGIGRVGGAARGGWGAYRAAAVMGGWRDNASSATQGLARQYV